VRLAACRDGSALPTRYFEIAGRRVRCSRRAHRAQFLQLLSGPDATAARGRGRRHACASRHAQDPPTAQRTEVRVRCAVRQSRMGCTTGAIKKPHRGGGSLSGAIEAARRSSRTDVEVEVESALIRGGAQRRDIIMLMTSAGTAGRGELNQARRPVKLELRQRVARDVRAIAATGWTRLVAHSQQCGGDCRCAGFNHDHATVVDARGAPGVLLGLTALAPPRVDALSPDRSSLPARTSCCGARLGRAVYVCGEPRRKPQWTLSAQAELG